MSVVEITSRPTWQPFKRFLFLFANLRRPSVHAEYDEAENRARRTFILEMMDAHPEAFQHEHDFQNMMELYPSRF